MSKETKSYEELSRELDDIMVSIDSEDSKNNLSELLKLYEKGEKILQQMQTQLDTAKNKITPIN